MTVRARSLAAAAAIVALAGAVPADAQPVRRPPRPDTPFLTVQVFRSADKQAGPAASDALRERLIQVFPGPVLWVIEKERMVELLQQSGYPTNEQLARTDENSLAKFMRADEYVRGNVTRQPDGEYRIDAQLVLTRDASLTQPLPAVTGRSPERAAVALVRPLQDARRQLDNEKKCREHAINGRFDDAVAEADKAISDYSNATLVRYCKINVLVQKKASSAELIQAADEILAIDPNNRVALAIGADAQKEAGNVEKANELLVRLLSNDPTNAKLAEDVVNALASSRQYDVAKQIVTQAVKDNPGDVSLVRLQFLILATAGDYKPAIATGEEMIQLDTALADVQFWTRLTALYTADSQPAKAADAARRGTNKYTENAELWQLYAQALRQSGDLPGSINAAKRALEINPYIPSAWLQITQGYMQLQQPDSALVALRHATAAGDNADLIASVASSIGNQMRVRADSVRLDIRPDSTKDIPEFQRAIAVLQFADSVAMLTDEVGPSEARRPRVQASGETRARVKFILGAAGAQLALAAGTKAGKDRSCELTAIADEGLLTAQINLPAGGQFDPQAAGSLLQSIPAVQNFLEQLKQAYCK
ncbi:MAG: tetratricopeptide repeat protein [Gemmatimonadaceae bacterium]|nr:tetratricopeptide repeat protein [Gemmatimonadaceae bacterium]